MEFLVRLIDKPDKPGKGAVSKKGDFITYKPDGWGWGSNERKHYGIVKIACTDKEAQKMCESETFTMLGTIKVVKTYRKFKFDIDAKLSSKMLAVWYDKNKNSPIITAEKL